MTTTVVGSIAFDAVQTPFGRRECMLGGAATHFALAASFFDEVRVVGPVGDDFGEADMAALATRGTSTDDVHRVAGGRTFFWRARYGWDLNSRTTIETQLNVFADFEPELSAEARECDVLFLANIQPHLQSRVLDQCVKPRFVALDSMGSWIETARDELLEVIARVDCVMLNDAELRELTSKPNVVSAARRVLDMGPAVVVAKQGEYGAVCVTSDSYFSLPAYPLETVVDPTGAGDSFAGGFVGYLARVDSDPPSEAALCQAMTYGTVLASFNVEGFGADRVIPLAADEIAARAEELHRLTQFAYTPVELAVA